jgi:hypothetical protein
MISAIDNKRNSNKIEGKIYGLEQKEARNVQNIIIKFVVRFFWPEAVFFFDGFSRVQFAEFSFVCTQSSFL